MSGSDRMSALELKRFFPGDSELAHLMRDLDWSKTDLGHPENWPENLRIAVSLCLTSRIPVVLYWGPNFTVLYNDPYISFLGETKHPRSLGQPGHECWHEIWDTIGPMLKGVYETAEATWSEDLLMFFARRLPLEEVYVRFTFGPILAADSRTVEGIFCPCTETTEQVIGARRLETLRKLGIRASDMRTVDAACGKAAEVLAENPHDIPFAAIYLVAETGGEARMSASTRLSTHPLLPASVSLVEGDSSPWQFASVFRTHRPEEISDCLLQSAASPSNDRQGTADPQFKAIVLPTSAATSGNLAGLLVVGISPQRVWDASYRTFFDLVANHVGTAIADAQAYEAERKRAEALAELDRAKTTFFSNVSHEFRTPLTLMLNPLADALANPSGPIPGDREQLEIAYRNSQRLLKLVNTLLDFSRIEAGRMEAAYELTDLAMLTTDLAGVFRSAIEQAGMCLRVDCPPLPEPAYVDREMWEKIVLNLLSNAFKFTFEGEIAVVLRSCDDHIELEVRDTGTGIPASELPYIFERFHQGKGARGRSCEGLGIGLSLVQELVRLHGGTIGVSSVVDRGTCFTVSIPTGCAHLPSDRLGAAHTLASTATGAATYLEEALRWPSKSIDSEVLASKLSLPVPVQLRQPSAPTARILLVDDNADMRDYLKRLLSQQYEVEAVADGVAALAAIRQQVPDLLLSDVRMPGLDGFELLRLLRSDPTSQDIPIILLSARAGEESRIEGLVAGADDYLTKPFSAHELLARVEANLKLARLRQEAAQQEQALRVEVQAAKDNLESVLTRIADQFLALDREWRYTYVNNRVTEVTRIARENLLGRSIWELFPDTVGSQFYTEVHRAVAEQTPVQFEYFYSTWNRWFENHVYPSADGVSIVVTEITERKQAEAALRASEERFRQIAETIEDVFWSTDFRVPQIIYVSPAYEKIWGRSRDELYCDYTTWLETIHPEDRERVQAIAATCQYQNFVENEYRIVRPDGAIRWIRDRGFAVRDEAGEIVQVVGVAQDITVYKQAEIALRQSDRRFKSVFNQQFQYMAILTPEGRIIDVNESPLRATGVKREDVLGQLFWETPWWTPLPDMQARWIAHVAQVVRGGAPVTGETFYATGDGTLRFSQYALTAVKDETDRVVNLIVQASDLNDHKRFEETLHRLVECATLKGERFFAALVRALAEALNARYAFICQVNPENPQQARTIAGWADGTWIENFEYSLLGTPCEQVVQNQICFYRSGVTRLFPDDRFLVDMGIESYLGAPLRASDGRTLGLLTALHDRPIDEIHQPEVLIQIFADQAAAELERQQVDEAVRVSEERLRSFVEADVVGILFGDVYGSVHQANDKLLRIVGYTRDDLQAGRLRWTDITPSEYLPLDRQHIAEAQAAGACTPYEKEYIRKDGSQVPVLVGYSLIGEAREESVAFILDLSDRKQAEEALRESENRLRLALESAELGTWDFNPITGTLKWDDRCKAMFGLSPAAEVNYDVFLAGLHPEDRDRTHQVVLFSLSAESGGEYDIEYRTVGIEDGVERWIAAKGKAFFNQAGVAIRFIGTVLNITEKKRVEAEREQLLQREQAAREAAEAANRVKDEFLAVVSHELRSPLNPILGWSKLLRSRQLDEQKTEHALEVIERNAQMQAQLISDLLDVSRILRGKLSLGASPVDLISTIQAAMETVRLGADAKSIQIHTMLDPEVGHIWGDPGRLQQVVWNLLSNAVKFTPRGGRVDIRLERLDPHAQITVSDTGKGIHPDFLPYVFDHFRQEDAATTRRFGGLGLGLAIVRYLVELHGGTVRADSLGEDQGATFTVELPLMPHKLTTNQDTKPFEQSLDLNGIQILVVDDDDSTREFIAFLLDLHGASVIATASAQQAIATLTQFKPDVLLSDIGMPDVDGYMLMRQVRSLPPAQGGQIPAIALTAYAGEINYQQAIAAGFQRHVSKPVEPERLVSAIADLVQQAGSQAQP